MITKARAGAKGFKQGNRGGGVCVCGCRAAGSSEDPGGSLRGLLRFTRPETVHPADPQGTAGRTCDPSGRAARAPPGGESDPALEQEMQLAAGVSCRKCKGSRRS